MNDQKNTMDRSELDSIREKYMDLLQLKDDEQERFRRELLEKDKHISLLERKIHKKDEEIRILRTETLILKRNNYLNESPRRMG